MKKGQQQEPLQDQIERLEDEINDAIREVEENLRFAPGCVRRAQPYRAQSAPRAQMGGKVRFGAHPEPYRRAAAGGKSHVRRGIHGLHDRLRYTGALLFSCMLFSFFSAPICVSHLLLCSSPPQAPLTSVAAQTEAAAGATTCWRSSASFAFICRQANEGSHRSLGTAPALASPQPPETLLKASPSAGGHI